MSKKLPKLIVILGPTASGKTELSLRLAKKFRGEIVSADSRTLYKGMDIGTSKPTPDERKRVKHHLIDIAKPNQVITLADWQKNAFKAINAIIKRKKTPFLVGGTGLYISSIIENYRIPKKKQKPRYEVLVLGLAVPRDSLYNRIDRRVISMIRKGLGHEVTNLSKKYPWSLPSMHGIGYREWQAFFKGSQSKQELIAEIQKKTRNFAKRQMTWFRGMERKHQIHWIASTNEAEQLIKAFLK